VAFISQPSSPSVADDQSSSAYKYTISKYICKKDEKKDIWNIKKMERKRENERDG